MVQEEEEQQQQRCSNSSSGGRLSRKMKQKKIPQRGLGVAQLEKIRLEEQLEKNSSVFLPLPHQSSSISFPPSIPTNSSSSSSLFRSSPSIPFSNYDLFIPPPPPPPPLTTKNFYVYPHEGSGDNGGSGYSSTMKNSCDLDGEIPKLDHRFNQTWHSWNMQNKEQQQQPSSMVNVSTSSSSGVNFQIEPPSNQSTYSNYTTPPMWPEEEKMVGMKRPWPFSLEYPPESSFNYKLPQLLPPICRLDESSLCVNGSGIFNLDPGNAFSREGPSNSASLNVEWRGSSSSSERNSKKKKSTKEEGSLDGKFLTLGPLPSSSSSTNSKAKQPLVFPAPHHQEFPEFNMLPNFPVCNDDSFFGSRRIVQEQQTPNSFFPSQQIHRLTSKSNNQRSEVGESLDLNLRL